MLDLRRRLATSFIALLLIILLGALGFSLVEHFSLLDSLYFTVVTVGTVGYGDIHPLTAPGKMLAIFLIVTGVGVFLGVIANFTELVISHRERQQRQQKMNMVIGVFYSEIGTRLLKSFAAVDQHLAAIHRSLLLSAAWSDKDFERVGRELEDYPFKVDSSALDLAELRRGLLDQRSLMVGLLENPSLQEHEAFTELLWSVFHLAEELAWREDLSQLPPSDLAHLSKDINRAYRPLAVQWLAYTRHLKYNYPYLFSLAMRTNPFNSGSTVVVQPEEGPLAALQEGQ